MARSARRLTLTATGIGIAVTLAAAFLPFVRFAYRNVGAHIALDAVEAVIALVAAYLVFGRFRERRLARDGLLVYALILLATTNLALSVLPRAAFGQRAALLGWISLATRLIGASALLVASVTKRRFAELRKPVPILLPTAAIGTIVLVSAVLVTVGRNLPFGVRTVLDASSTAEARLEGHPVLLATQLLLVVIFAVASMSFTREAERTNDPMLRWLGAGMAFASIARVNYFMFPSIYSSYIYTGDLLRFGFYLSLLAGASAEVRQYWSRLERDRIERERMIQELEQLSLVDPLTGLSNRRSFFTVATQELKLHARSGRALCGVFVDLDDMKGINDRFGHAAGDAALRESADLLRASFRESDLIARIGGDEFCVLIAEGEAELAADRLRRSVRERRPTGDMPYRLSLSVGVAAFDPERHRSVEDLLAEADRQMYEQKRDRVRESR